MRSRVRGGHFQQSLPRMNYHLGTALTGGDPFKVKRLADILRSLFNGVGRTGQRAHPSHLLSNGESIGNN